LILPSTSAWRPTGLGLLLALVAGCSKSGSSAEVTGTVRFDGKPLPGVVVTFYPVVPAGEPRLPFSRATTDAAGKFALISEDGKPGAVVGQHRVVVNWPVRSGHEMKANPDPGPPIPVPYTSVTETPLQNIEVKAGQNDIPIEVKRL
jgi:hypothetical protein